MIWVVGMAVVHWIIRLFSMIRKRQIHQSVFISVNSHVGNRRLRLELRSPPMLTVSGPAQEPIPRAVCVLLDLAHQHLLWLVRVAFSRPEGHGSSAVGYIQLGTKTKCDSLSLLFFFQCQLWTWSFR